MKKSIAIIAPVTMPPTKGDAVNTFNFAMAARSAGLDVTIFAFGKNTAQSRVNIVTFPLKPSPFSLFFFSLWASIKAKNYDRIIVRNWIVSFSSLLLLKLLSKKVIYEHPFTSYLEAKYKRKPFAKGIKLIEKWNCKLSWRVRVSSRSLEKIIKCKFAVNKEKVRFVPLTMPAKENKKELKEFILYIGTLDKWQGIPELLRAYNFISTKTNVPLLILSHDKVLGNVIRYLKENNIYDRLSIKSAPNDEVLRYYAKAKFLVIPRPSNIVTENIAPIKLFEAMAAGVPILATNVGGVNEFFTHKKNVYLVSPNNSKQLAEAMLLLLEDSTLTNTLGEKGAESISSTYSWFKVGKKISKLIAG